LEQAYSPMTVRFFMLQSQYRSTLDFSNEALKAAQKGYKRIANGLRIIKGMEFEADSTSELAQEQIVEIDSAIQGCYDGMNDDLNTAVTISHLFTLLKKINQLHTGQLAFGQIGEETFDRLKTNYINFLEQVLGLREEFPSDQEALIKGMLALYSNFKEKREYDKVDEIRASFKAMGLLVKDMKTRIDWAYEE
jgi:cysteinyl-tRNA synthetase